MAEAYVAALAAYLPPCVVTNADLAAQHPSWDMARIESKVGIVARHVAGASETAGDLAFEAATRLLGGGVVDRGRIDAILLCTQSPDYLLPTTACVLQDRLGLSTQCAALDFNQGCSGYIYGLAIAKGLVAAGIARNVLLLTSETYSKYCHPQDRSVRVLFGDAATATVVSAEPVGARIGTITLGTDGSGYRNLIVPAGGARLPRRDGTAVEHTDDSGSTRSDDDLFMDGPELFAFTLRRVPEVVRSTLSAAQLHQDDIAWFVFHQANAFMNEHLRAKLKIPRDRALTRLADVGNTVSSTIPLTLLSNAGKLQSGQRTMLVGFGVGYSWGAALLDWGDVTIVAD